MHPQYCRYTSEQLREIGVNLNFNEHCTYVDFDPVKARQEMDEFVKGKFKNIIDILYNSSDGSLDNDIDKYVSENCPESVRSFVQNVLLTNVQAFRSAPDDHTAFDTLIPRSAQSASEVLPFLSKMAQIVSESRALYEGSVQSQPSTTQTE